MVDNQQLHGNVEEIDAGDSLISWETWEYPPHERSKQWYVIAGTLAIALIIYSIYTSNFLFAIIILMMGVLILLSSLRQPNRIDVHITTLGVVVGTSFHSYKEIKDFSIIYNPPDVMLLYVDFKGWQHPLLALPLENTNPNDLRNYLLPYVFENLERDEENLTDLVRRLYKF